MSIKTSLISAFKISVGSGSLITAFISVLSLMQFLSYAKSDSKYLAQDWELRNITWNLLIDMVLLTLFILQHSCMADIRVKSIFHKLHCTDIQRAVYVICTSLCLMILVHNWVTIPGIYLWQFQLNSRLVWSFYYLSHAFAWLMIYAGTIFLDVNELLGIKQIYYSLSNLPNPNSCKSIDLQRFYAHMRHPGFLSFLIAFWFVPTMTMDRLLLNTIITLYMYIAWNPDEADYRYQQLQNERKHYELIKFQ